MIQLNHQYRKRFVTKLVGIATAADITPTAILYRNGSASGVTVTVSTTAETGVYLATFTTDAAWTKTDHLELLVSATIDGDSGYKVVLWDSDSDPDAPMRGTDNANTAIPLDSTETQAAAAAAITAANLPTASEISVKIALDVDNGDNRWDGAINTLGSQIAVELWQSETRTLTTIGNSPGVDTLLVRVPGTVRTATEDATAETSQTTAIRDGLALEGSLNEIKGTGFNSATHALKLIFDSVGIIDSEMLKLGTSYRHTNNSTNETVDVTIIQTP